RRVEAAKARALPAIRFHVDPYALARDEVCYVGEPIALVVAESRRIAEDAAPLVALELEPLPAVADPRAGLERGAPRARLDWPDNLVAHWVVQYGDVEAAFAGARIACPSTSASTRVAGMRLTRYVVVHDCGRMINPMMVEGQVHGAVVHGIGSTLLEWMRYDDAGQPLTVTFADYLLPTTDLVPPIEIHHMESPTPLNPLGVKGAAESGTIAAPAAIV